MDALAARMGVTFPIVTERAMEVAKAYGVRQRGLDLALPATFVVDEGGTVRFVRVGANPLDRPTAADLVAVLARTR